MGLGKPECLAKLGQMSQSTNNNYINNNINGHSCCHYLYEYTPSHITRNTKNTEKKKYKCTNRVKWN